MVEIISRSKTHTVIKFANKLAPNFDVPKRKFIGKEYIEDSKEKKEIDGIKRDFESGKFLTLKEFLLEN